MNKELKEQAHNYFEENLLDGDKMEDCGKAIITIDQDFIEVFDSLIDKTVQICGDRKVDENTSDGYHTFKELYEFRKIYNACLFNEWAKQGKYSVHKSERHSDGELCFGGGWFIVVATLPDGDISNHYKMKDWDLFDCGQQYSAKEWDGHTSQDVVTRLLSLITNKSDINK